MISYFDTSALLKLLIEESGSDFAAALWSDAQHPATSAIAIPEARSALARRHREGALSTGGYRTVAATLHEFIDAMHIVPVSRKLATHAGEDAERHRLRGCDAIHLASARSFSTDRILVATWDVRLADAATGAGLFAAGVVTRHPRDR